MPLNSALSAMIDGQWGAHQAYTTAHKRRMEKLKKKKQKKEDEGYRGYEDYRAWATWDAPGPFPEGGYGTGAGAYVGTGGYPPPPTRRGKGKATPAKPAWSTFDYRPPGAPAWWRAMKPGTVNEQTELLASVNMMIPFLSPEDQVQAAALLARSEPEHFGHLGGALAAPPSAELSRGMRERYTGKERILHATQALDRLRGVIGKKEEDMGEGFRYLKQLAQMMGGFTRGGAPQSRLGFQQMAAGVMPLLEQAPSKSYGSVAKMLAQPFFSGGQLMPAEKVGGKWLFGAPHKELYA